MDQGYQSKYNSEQSIQVDAITQNTLIEIARWTKFLGIIGFVFMAIMIAIGFFAAYMFSHIDIPGNNPFSAFGGFALAFLYIILAALYVYPLYALLKYSSLIKEAFRLNNQASFNRAFGYLKSMFKYVGILMIICLCIYGIWIIGFGIFTAMRLA